MKTKYKELKTRVFYNKKMSMFAIWIRMTDKMQRIKGWLNDSDLKVKDEKIDDTLKDLSIYATIFQIVMIDKWKKPLVDNSNKSK